MFNPGSSQRRNKRFVFFLASNVVAKEPTLLGFSVATFRHFFVGILRLIRRDRERECSNESEGHCGETLPNDRASRSTLQDALDSISGKSSAPGCLTEFREKAMASLRENEGLDLSF